MRLTLRLRLLLFVLAMNLVLVGGTTLLLGREARLSADQVGHDLIGESAYLLRGLIDPDGGLNVKSILEWPSWPRFADAVLLDDRWTRTESGRIVPNGVALNPLGRSRRGPDFDEQVVYEAITRATREGRPIDDVQGGRAVPIDYPEGAWGGFWYRLPRPVDSWTLFRRYLLVPFLASLVLLTAGTFLALRRFVLDPVSELAAGARRMAAGDFSVRLPVPERADELADLLRGFNAMSAEVQGFNARLETEVRRATEQAQRAEAAAFMQRRLAATGELAAGIAHEINNPLGGLLNAVEVLGREDLTPQKRAQYLELLQGGLERIRRIVGQLLRFTPRRTDPVAVVLTGPVLDAIGLVRHRARELGCALSFNGRDVEACETEVLRDSVGDLGAILAEPNEIAQAVLNLLVNALDSLAGVAHERRLDVDLRPTRMGVLLEVRDNGPGVTAEELERVADIFYTTKDPGRGTGLGLPLVFNAVQTSGGRIVLESAPGRGFVARIEWPLPAQAHAARPRRPGEDPRGTAREGAE